MFYGTARVHKLQTGEGIKEKAWRPIISNIGTATYKTAKYLNTFSTPLVKSKSWIQNCWLRKSELKRHYQDIKWSHLM